MIHFFSQFEPRDPDTALRNKVAAMTWEKQPWTERPIPDAELKRMWKEDGKSMPFIKDLFDIACDKADVTEIACYSNTDVCVRTDCAFQIAAHMQETNAAYCFRRDFNHDFTEPIPDADIEKGNDYSGSDLYAFRVGWWIQYRGEFPDLVAGLETWDLCMRVLIEDTNKGCNVTMRNLIFHRRHGGLTHWEHPNNRYKWAGQKRVLTLAKQFLLKHGRKPYWQ